jgi:hypothetical protein
MGNVLPFTGSPPPPDVTVGKLISLDILCAGCDQFIVVDLDLAAPMATKDANAIDLYVGQQVNAALISHHMLECPARHAQ